MAQLKHHLLREIAIDLCEREANRHFINITSLPSIEMFILAGKEPSRVFRRIVEDYVTITFLTFDTVHMTYCALKTVYTFHYPHRFKWEKYGWKLDCVYLNNLFIKWARKLKASEWLYASPRLGYLKVMTENNDLEELCLEEDRFNFWATIFKAFPKLGVVRTSACDFASMLLAASTELTFLKVVELNGTGTLDVAYKALYDHQSKCPNLETIQYRAKWLEEICFPKSTVVPSIKHIRVTVRYGRCCTPWNFSFLTVFQKAFPSLESVEIVAHKRCCCYTGGQNVTQKLTTMDEFYQAFQSLHFGFTIKIIFREIMLFLEGEELLNNVVHPFFISKGQFFGEPERFTVKTSYPGKQVIYEGDIRLHIYDDGNFFVDFDDF
uniref:F-box domain-containing protein n=1 Tax=Panagrellus redivivus TaxID=6233 RepID=A0A7E4VWM9_PANRE